jgi:hypothetical protein
VSVAGAPRRAARGRESASARRSSDSPANVPRHTRWWRS